MALLAAGALLGGFAMMLGNSVWESTLQRNVPPAVSTLALMAVPAIRRLPASVTPV